MEHRLVTTIPYNIYALGIILATIFVPSILVRDKKNIVRTVSADMKRCNWYLVF